MPRIPPFIFGLYDFGGEKPLLSAGKPGWVELSVQVDDGGGDFTSLDKAGVGIIVRLNNGYQSLGTIPLSSRYDVFALSCARYVTASRGVHIWVIGNHTNLQGERPGNSNTSPGEIITPTKYADCFAKCRQAIKKIPGHEDDWVIPAPVGPWNTETKYTGNTNGNWVQYFRDLLGECIKRGAPPDAIALHAYTHGFDTSLLTSEARMPPAFPSNHLHWRVYRDFLAVVPSALRSRPVLITEARPSDPGWWENKNIGWIQAAYAETNQWNSNPSNQAIYALVLFRWERGEDHTSISDKPLLLEDLQAALKNDYRVRMPAAPPSSPAPATGPSAAGWCPFATKRPIVKANYHAGRDGSKVNAVVLHIATGPLTAIFPTFNNPKSRSSSHFCIGKDGTIEQYVSIHDTAYGNGLRWLNRHWFTPSGRLVRPTWTGLVPGVNPNLYTISIEHEGQPQDKWTAKMYEADIKLLQWLAQQCNFKYVAHRTLIGHNELNPADRPNDPGPNVNFEKIAQDANAGVEPPKPQTAKKAMARGR